MLFGRERMQGVVSMQGTAGVAFLPDFPPDHILLLSSAGPLALVSCPHTGPLGLRIPSAHSNFPDLLCSATTWILKFGL